MSAALMQAIKEFFGAKRMWLVMGLSQGIKVCSVTSLIYKSLMVVLVLESIEFLFNVMLEHEFARIFDWLN